MSEKSFRSEIEFPKDDDYFKFLAELGQGSYGKVYKAIDNSTQQYAAVKVNIIIKLGIRIVKVTTSVAQLLILYVVDYEAAIKILSDLA